MWATWFEELVSISAPSFLTAVFLLTDPVLIDMAAGLVCVVVMVSGCRFKSLHARKCLWRVRWCLHACGGTTGMLRVRYDSGWSGGVEDRSMDVRRRVGYGGQAHSGVMAWDGCMGNRTAHVCRSGRLPGEMRCCAAVDAGQALPAASERHSYSVQQCDFVAESGRAASQQLN